MPYFASVQQPGRSPNEQRYLAGQFQNVLNEYLGALGQQAQAGTPLSEFTSFQDYLAPNRLGARFSALSPLVAGRGTRRFAPPTRFLTSF